MSIKTFKRRKTRSQAGERQINIIKTQEKRKKILKCDGCRKHCDIGTEQTTDKKFVPTIKNTTIVSYIDKNGKIIVAENNIDLAWVPGSFEIPLVAKKMAESKKYDAVICLGAVIRGATAHFEMVANETTKGIAAASLQTGVPVIFGVLTTDNIEQAVERAGSKAGNKGFEAVTTAIEMINLMKQI